MKAYSLDWGWAGLTVVIASSREKALDIISEKHHYLSNRNGAWIDEVEEHNLVEGLCFINYGDS